jgi:hypothetical protein
MVVCAIVAIIAFRYLSVPAAKRSPETTKELSVATNQQLPPIEFVDSNNKVALIWTPDGDIRWDASKHNTKNLCEFFWNQTWSLRDKHIIIIIRKSYNLVIDFDKRIVNPVANNSAIISKEIIEFWKNVEKSMPKTVTTKK